MPKLEQISTISQDSTYGASALATILAESPLLQVFEQNAGFELDAVDFSYRTNEIAKAAEARARGGAYTPSDMTLGTPNAKSQAMYGGRVDVDIQDIISAQKGLSSLQNVFEKRLRSALKSWARSYEVALFQGAGTSNTIAGLKTLINGTDDVTGMPSGEKCLVNAQTFVGGTAKSFDLSVSTKYGLFAEKLFESILTKTENAKAIICAPAMAARLTTVARTLHQYSTSENLFGQPVATFNGIPIIAVKSESILLTEPDDTGTPL